MTCLLTVHVWWSTPWKYSFTRSLSPMTTPQCIPVPNGMFVCCASHQQSFGPPFIGPPFCVVCTLWQWTVIVQVRRHTCTMTHLYNDTPVRWHTCTMTHLYDDTPVQWHTCLLLLLTAVFFILIFSSQRNPCVRCHVNHDTVTCVSCLLLYLTHTSFCQDAVCVSSVSV